MTEPTASPTSGQEKARYDAWIDARGLACPLPLVRARQALMVLEAGARICVLATDSAAPRDFAEFCEASGHLLIDQREADGVYLFVIEKV